MLEAQESHATALEELKSKETKLKATLTEEKNKAKKELSQLREEHQAELTRVEKEAEKRGAKAAVKEFKRSQAFHDLLEKFLKEYKSSSEFKDLLEGEGGQYYTVGFEDALAKVKNAYPDFDLNGIKIGEDTSVPPTPVPGTTHEEPTIDIDPATEETVLTAEELNTTTT